MKNRTLALPNVKTQTEEAKSAVVSPPIHILDKRVADANSRIGQLLAKCGEKTRSSLTVSLKNGTFRELSIGETAMLTEAETKEFRYLAQMVTTVTKAYQLANKWAEMVGKKS